MPELREVFEMTTRQMEPDVGAWRDQEQRQRRASRNRKVGALAVTAAVLLAVGIVTMRAVSDRARPRTPLTPTERPADGLALVDLQGAFLGTIGSDAGEDAQVLLKHPEWGISLSPDGSRIAVSNGFDISTMALDGTGLAKLTEGVNPAWSPDGSTIAFADDEGIHLISADGTDRRTLVRARGADVEWPSWSPDGQRIAYQVSAFSPGNGIYVVDAAGGRPVRVTRGPDAFPAWHPDGASIVFTRLETNQDQDLFTVAVDGDADPVPIVATDRYESVGRWSPSGDLLAYVAFDTVYDQSPDPVESVHVLDTRTGEERLVAEAAIPIGWRSDQVLLIAV